MRARESCLIHDLVESSEGNERSGGEGGDTVVCVIRKRKDVGTHNYGRSCCIVGAV